MADLSPGEIVADRYRIDRRIGTGGMGYVYEAHDATTGRRVAIKVLHPALQRHPVIPKRFVQEAMAAQALTTPFAVKVEGSGNLPDGCPFLVMEYLHGVDLGTLARQAGGKLEVDRVVRLADQIASALEEAHARGIVHRDLKPENIFVVSTPSGEMAKVMDFGISKILTREDGIRLTQTGTTLGTPQYMPMEQLRGAKDLDGRVDVYALGVMLYEVLAGVRPYDGFTYEEVILKVATTAPPSLASHRNDLPSALVELVDCAMQRERDARIGSMTEVRHHLATVDGDARRSSSGALSPISMRPSSATMTRSSAVLPIVAVVLLVSAGGLLLAVGGVGIWYYLSLEKEPATVKVPDQYKPAATTTTRATGRQQTK